MNELLDHIENLSEHIARVQRNARKLAEALIEKGRVEFARVLLAKAHVHDASKWHGIEWDCLHREQMPKSEVFQAAIAQHQKTNDHHPEFWGGLVNMPEICVAELACDWLARSQEFATDLRAYIKNHAAARYDFNSAPDRVAWLNSFLDDLLPEPFHKV